MPKVFFADDAAADIAFARGTLAGAGREVVTCDKALEAEVQPDALFSFDRYEAGRIASIPVPKGGTPVQAA